ncbi:MAG: LacI family DNA-binding transcriptional regulator [Chitinophagaceae bacterium]|nr:LacI family DNA-binding transcriptional regulator [Chitinophagaceae bacterium]
MRFEAATIKDIARSLGFSPSTVSRALRNCNDISETTKQLVLDYANKINYTPNPIALSLKARRSRSIGVIVHEIADSFFSQIINGIECIARESGYNVIVAQSLGSYENEMSITRMLASRSIDGCLVSLAPGTTDISHFTNLQERGLPIVFFDRTAEALSGHKVLIDNKLGGFKGTHHLLKNHCRRIAFIGDSPHQYITGLRLEGYKKALSEHHFEIDESLIKYCPYGGSDPYEVETVMHQLFYADNKPDAIFTSTDKLTIASMRCCRDMKINIPGTVALAGFSNMDNTDLFCPSLTVIRQPAIQMGKVAARLLIKTVESKKPLIEFERQMLPVELRIGDSSKGRVHAITA